MRPSCVCLALLQPSPKAAEVLLPRWTSTIYTPPCCSIKAFRGHQGCFFAAERISGPTNNLLFTMFPSLFFSHQNWTRVFQTVKTFFPKRKHRWTSLICIQQELTRYRSHCWREQSGHVTFICLPSEGRKSISFVSSSLYKNITLICKSWPGNVRKTERSSLQPRHWH